MREKPRERKMPLVPKPFDEVTISTQAVFFGGLGGSPMAHTWCRFCPNLNFPEYLRSLSEEKRDELAQRAFTLAKRSCINHLYKSSEFGWEVCAWHDVFGLILDDEGLRIDKRPYEFVDRDEDGKVVMKTRIPDATMGLKSYDDYFLKRGYVCADPDCNDDHSAKEPDERLSEDLLSGMMMNSECGLVVDGVWGKTDLLFPFAVYEAKKRARSYANAEAQIYHACKTYLAMLDDLARNPDNLSEYQSEGSDRYQIFAFTSCGSDWQVFVSWNFVNECMVETIWRGDAKNKGNALELICLVDQIHDYATKQHRPFVMKHLEAWHHRHKRTKVAAPNGQSYMTAKQTVASTSEGLCSSNNEDISSSVSSLGPNEKVGMPDFELYPNIPLPQWHILKDESASTRNEKARQTRFQNRMLRRIETESREKTNTPGKKRGRGRPRKETIHKQKVLKKSHHDKWPEAVRSRDVTKTKPGCSRITRSMIKNV